jgi:serine protease Do
MIRQRMIAKMRWRDRRSLLFAAALALVVGVQLVVSAVPPVRAQPAEAALPTLAPLVREITPSVVNISVRGRVREDNPLYRDPFFRQFFDLPRQVEREIQATGSGVIVDAQRGYVLTANHVVARVSNVQVTLKDGRRFEARVVGRDPDTDIAVLQLKGAGGLKAIPMGDSDKVEVGDFVLAVGNPFGLGQTVTSGIVSALGRTGLGKQGYEDYIQTDAAINPGNSGGALVNMRGQLIGINTAILSSSGGNIGIGFAVPINMARRVMEQLIAHGQVRRGRIGVSIQDLPPDGRRAAEGALVAEVLPGSAAERAGIRKGDVILAINGVPVRSAAQVRNTVGLTPVGHQVLITLERSGAKYDVNVEVAPANNTPERRS